MGQQIAFLKSIYFFFFKFLIFYFFLLINGNICSLGVIIFLASHDNNEENRNIC